MPAEEEENPTAPRRRRARLIVRLGSLLVAHSVFVSVMCCTAGVAAILLLPALAKTTYISENALMPGSANPLFSSQDVSTANGLIKEIFAKRASGKGSGSEMAKLIGQHMADVGAEVYYHKFQPLRNQFHPLHFFSSIHNPKVVKQNDSCVSSGVNTVGIIRAPRGDGKEAIVMVTPYNTQNIQAGDALALGLAFSIFSHISRVTWLAKDIVWLAADSQYGEYNSVAAWLKDYHNPVFINELATDAFMCFESDIPYEPAAKEYNENIFRRAGTMAAALIFKVVENKESGREDCLTIYAEGSNGQMPNLDLINIVHYLAAHRQGFRVKVGIVGSLLHSAWLKLVGETLQVVNKVVKSFNSKSKIDISVADYLEGMATLASSMYYQAIGVPTGPHGAFRDYQVDAVTLELSPASFFQNEILQSSFILRGGRLIEGVVRSINNLLEKFHQSFFLYFLTAPNKFVSVGVYMIGFALVIAPLPIVAVAVSSTEGKPSDSVDSFNQKPYWTNTEKAETSSGSWRWLCSARTVVSVHIWAVIVALLPYLLSQCSHISPSESMLSWVGFAVVMFVALYLILGSQYKHGDWKTLKANTIACFLIGLILMSIINFATAQIGAMFLVPLCLLVRPLRSQMQATLSLKILLLFLNLVSAILGFPPATLLMIKAFSGELGSMKIGAFWELAEYLWSWNSATYMYIVLIHLPCWVLCLHVLLHP